MKKFISDFKDFAMKGNVIDMAVGIVIGTAFGAIVSALVDNIIMPLVSLAIGCVNFSELSAKVTNWAGNEVDIQYGLFIQAIVDFFLIALSIFIVIKIIGAVKRKFIKEKEAAPAEPPAPSKEEVLLTEIRDLLKEQNKK